MKREGDFSEVSYTLGLMSIVLAFFTPLAGFVIGVVGFVYSKKQKSQMAEKARKLNAIGMILSIVLFVITLIAAISIAKSGGIGALI